MQVPKASSQTEQTKEINGLGVHGAQQKVLMVNFQTGNLLPLE